MIRDAFVRELNARFRKLRATIVEAIVDRDVLGLIEEHSSLVLFFQSTPMLRNLVSLPAKAFAFDTDPNKVEGFMSWLRQEMDEGILGIRRGPSGNVVMSDRWSDVYIEASYRRGVKRADTELAKKGIGERKTDRAIESAFRSPIHADRVGLMYTRTFEELKNITDSAATMIRRSLSESIAEGRNPRQMARILLKRLDGVGADISMTDSMGRHMDALRRARIMARTETIRAHHVATINEYKSAGIEGVKIQAEWSTAGDDRVCPDCADLENRVFTLAEIEGLIPLHPQCRCVALPLLAGEKPEITKTIDEMAGDNYRSKKTGLPYKKRGLLKGKGVKKPARGKVVRKKTK